MPVRGRFTGSPQRILIAWKPTRECASAVASALPLLQRAQQIDVVCADKNAEAARQAAAPLGRYLRLRGVQAVREHTDITGHGGDAGNHLLSLAAELGTDMLVMGCYGHSRARESILGGATRTVLETMTCRC